MKPIQYSSLIFSFILLSIGCLGFIFEGPTSNNQWYNYFHILSGAIGLIITSTFMVNGARWFLFIFGIIDLYQWVASGINLPPSQIFQYTPVDDTLHFVLGFILIFLALGSWKYGYSKRTDD